MKYKRLTKIESDKEWVLDCDNCEHKRECSEYGNSMEENYQYCLERIGTRLAELEDKIEQGTLIELPCKVGDTVYRVYDFGSVSGECIDIDEGKVDGVSHQEEGIWVHARYESGLTYWHKQEEIGKRLFLTREEAEKRLKELQNG